MSVERILRRGLLVAFLVGLSQAVTFGLGWLWVYEETHEEVAGSVEEVIVQSNVMAAEAVMRALGGIPNVDDKGSQEWKRTQEAIQDLELGGGGFACVLDSDGNISCHPEIAEMPGLNGINLGDELFLDLEGETQGRVEEQALGSVVSGVVDLDFAGKHYLATVQDPTSGGRLMVHQPVSGLEAASGHVTSSILTTMITVGLLLITLTASLATILVRAHDRTMAGWNAKLENMVEDRSAKLVRSHRTVLFGIAKLAEQRDNDTGKHVERMCLFTRLLAEEYDRRFGGLEPQWIRDVEVAAAMHDIGKVSIPDSILLKPGKLTHEEFERMKQHASVGEQALAAVRDQSDDPTLLELGIEIAGGHHERWDGAGYPRGLKAEQIPLSARLVAVADVFDALMSKRVYKPAMPFEKVLTIVRESSGAHFDPRVVECFEAVAGDLCEVHRLNKDVQDPPPIIPHAATLPVELAA